MKFALAALALVVVNATPVVVPDNLEKDKDFVPVPSDGPAAAPAHLTRFNAALNSPAEYATFKAQNSVHSKAAE